MMMMIELSRTLVLLEYSLNLFSTKFQTDNSFIVRMMRITIVRMIRFIRAIRVIGVLGC